MFFGCVKITSLNLSHFNLENVVSIYSMFGTCDNLESIDLFYNTQNINNMSSLFSNCYRLTSID